MSELGLSWMESRGIQLSSLPFNYIVGGNSDSRLSVRRDSEIAPTRRNLCSMCDYWRIQYLLDGKQGYSVLRIYRY